MIRKGSEMAERLMEKLRADSEAPDLGRPSTADGKMAAKPDAPPGVELDAQGQPIPLDQRTRHQREEALRGVKQM